MKRKGLFLVTLILTICIVSNVTVLANWELYEETQYVSGNAVRVHKSYNDAGQTVYSAYNSYGNLILDVRARGGNIWNETTQVLCTSTNKGSDYVGISSELDVYGLNQTSNPMKYRNGFENGEVPYVKSDVYATSMQTDSNGVLIGFYTSNGVACTLDGNSYNSNANNYCDNNNYNSYNSAYHNVVQDGNEYRYYYNANEDCYIYEYTSNSRRLSHDGQIVSGRRLYNSSSSISNITEIAFGKGYIGAVTTSNTVKIIPVGQNLQVAKEYNKYFTEWIYESSNSYWIIGYRDIYGNSYYFNSYNNNNYNNNYNNNNNNYYGNYPYIYQDDAKYVYYENANLSYTYSYVFEKLTYNGRIVSVDVEQVEFAKGYLLYVNSNQECRKVRLGSTVSEHVCYNFREFNYDYSGFVNQVISSNGTYNL